MVAAINAGLASVHAKTSWGAPTLDGAQLEREALRREGASAIGDGDWRGRLSILLADLESTAQLNPLGRVMANGQIVNLLRARIRAERLLAEHPEIADRPLPSPVVILGPMRSGTTRLHRLLACDPGFAHTRLFESLEPVPKARRPLDRILVTAAVTKFLHLANPATQTIHPTGSLQAEEEFGLGAFSFHGAQLEAQWRVPNFARLCEQLDPSEAYAEFVTLLRVIGWSRGDPGDRPWLLKSPQFMADLPGLLRVLPDARLLCLSRDPVQVVGSSASLVWNQQRVQSDVADPRWIGAEWLRKSVDRQARTDAVLAARPSLPRLHVEFDEVGADWEAAIRRIYRFLDRPLTTATLGRMRRYVAGAKAHRGHRYTLEQFGLDDAQVRRAYAQLPAASRASRASA